MLNAKSVQSSPGLRYYLKMTAVICPTFVYLLWVYADDISPSPPPPPHCLIKCKNSLSSPTFWIITIYKIEYVLQQDNLT